MKSSWRWSLGRSFLSGIVGFCPRYLSNPKANPAAHILPSAAPGRADSLTCSDWRNCLNEGGVVSTNDLSPREAISLAFSRHVLNSSVLAFTASRDSLEGNTFSE